MFTLIFAEIISGFKRMWRLYLTNILAILFIVSLYGFLDGSRRQLNLQETAFSGETIVQMTTNIDDIENQIKSNIKEVEYVSKKLECEASYRIKGNNNSIFNKIKLIGADFKNDKKLINYLTLKEGSLPKNNREILIPSSLLKKVDIKVGSILFISGMTSAHSQNSSIYKVSGIYNAPGLSVFDTPKLLLKYSALESFYMPTPKDIRYCLFFKKNNIPENINARLKSIFKNEDKNLIYNIESVRINALDVINLSVQFNVFLVLMMILTIFVVATVVTLVNFNFSLIMFRKRRKELGTLMSFGVKPTKIGLTLFLESIFQLLLSTFVAVGLSFVLSLLAKQQIAGGFVEVLFVLLSGTNRIDLYIQLYSIVKAFLWIFIAVTISQIPIFIQIITKNPIEMLEN